MSRSACSCAEPVAHLGTLSTDVAGRTRELERLWERASQPPTKQKAAPRDASSRSRRRSRLAASSAGTRAKVGVKRAR